MTDQDRWWQVFFENEPLVAFWASLVPRDHTEREADFLERELAVAPGARVLDVPCGTGRHVLTLATRGYEVTGIDLSTTSLALAREAATLHGVDVLFLHADIRQLELGASFDGAFCMGNSFGYFDDADNTAFLRSVASSLKQGGRFILDAAVAAEIVIGSFTEREWFPVENKHLLIQRRYEPRGGRLFVHYIVMGSEQQIHGNAVFRVYTCRELVSLFESAGFTNIKLIGGLNSNDFSLGDKACIVRAEVP